MRSITEADREKARKWNKWLEAREEKVKAAILTLETQMRIPKDKCDVYQCVLCSKMVESGLAEEKGAEAIIKRHKKSCPISVIARHEKHGSTLGDRIPTELL